MHVLSHFVANDRYRLKENYCKICNMFVRWCAIMSHQNSFNEHCSFKRYSLFPCFDDAVFMGVHLG